jgi:hypothetical protein
MAARRKGRRKAAPLFGIGPHERAFCLRYIVYLASGLTDPVRAYLDTISRAGDRFDETDALALGRLMERPDIQQEIDFLAHWLLAPPTNTPVEMPEMPSLMRH